MASSLPRKLYGGSLTRYRANAKTSLVSFCTKSLSSAESEADSDSDSDFETTRLSSSNLQQFTSDTERTLENGLDLGVYKAILIGKLGQAPIPKKLKSGRTVTLLSVGTGGIRNNRRPLNNEEPRDYANRCAVQWHRVSLYPERLGELAVKNFAPGSILYVEGNLETKIFNDPISGFVRRIREIAVRRNGMPFWLRLLQILSYFEFCWSEASMNLGSGAIPIVASNCYVRLVVLGVPNFVGMSCIHHHVTWNLSW